MTADIDSGLRRLAGGDHPGISALDETVIARIRDRRRSDAVVSVPFIALAVFGAVALGATAGTVTHAARPTASLSSFGPSNPLAPSTLLASDR